MKLSPESLELFLAKQPTPLQAINPDAQLLHQLTALDRRELEQLITEERYEPGEFICREGDAGDAAYIIRSGQAVVVRGPENALIILGYCGPSEIIGEMALVDDQPRSASIIALTDLRLLRMSRASFETLLSRHPKLGMRVMAAISARLRAADEIRDTTTKIGKRLARRVTELQTREQQLLEIQRVRQETTDFIIHDLRNPLSIILNAIQLLEIMLPEDIVTDNQDVLTVANSACQRMRRLVDSLLDTTRLESGDAVLELDSVDLHALVDGILEQVKPAIKSHEVTVCTAIGDDVPTVQADADKVERVLWNLLDNALKHTPRWGTITIGAQRQGDIVAVSVNDTGPGIPPEERERIFERFAQVACERKSQRGFGLGLSFCDLAVQAHGGSIWVEPGNDGVGSKFVFTLPAKE